MKKIVLMAGVAMLSVACGQDAVSSANNVDKPASAADKTPQVKAPLFNSAGMIRGLAGRIQGSIGEVRNINAAADVVDFYDDGYTSYGTVTVNNEDGSLGMLILNVSAEGGLRALKTGEAVRNCGEFGGGFDDGEVLEDGEFVDEGEVVVAATGCSGVDGEIDYDAPADCTEVVVEEPAADAPEGTVATVNVLAHFGSGASSRTVKGQYHLTDR